MLIRLRVRGFKNLVDVEIPFGPFTCFAGANGVGKSNLFDALMFLRDLTEFPIVEAAARVRDPIRKSGDIRALFTRTASGYMNQMSFEADLLVPTTVEDDFGRKANPVATFLNYKLSFRLVENNKSSTGAEIQLEQEELNYISSSQARDKLIFEHSHSFRKSTVSGPGKRTVPFITTEAVEDGRPEINLHTDGGRSGKPFRVPALSSPKTLLGGTNTNSHPTVLAAKREMQSWKLLQLEPSALRQPDDFSSDSHVSVNGANLPSALLRLKATAKVANKLSNLIPDAREVYVDEDEGRRLRTLLVAGRDGVRHPARSLSDGTLRFLALSVISIDPEAGGLICLEEPENGIHPSRIPSMLTLLKDIAVNPMEEVGENNPLRQVIINTHSPSVVTELPEDSLIFTKIVKSTSHSLTTFQCIQDTWRNKKFNMPAVARGELLSYLTGAPYVRRKKKVEENSVKTVGDFGMQQKLFEFMDELVE
jgi:predicted ATPase